jgi:hypothetical protein
MVAPRDEIMAIASKLRKVADSYIKNREGLGGSIAGYCIAISLALKCVLEKNGFPSSVIRGKFLDRGHAWVEIQGMIVDISQDQFGKLPSVWVSEVGDQRYTEVVDDEEFERDIGIGGDDVLWTYIDSEGEECPLGTTNSVASDLCAMYDASVDDDDGTVPTQPDAAADV